MLLSGTALADDTLAVTAFEQAESLRKAGNWERACTLYEVSYKEDKQLGVLLHLADCHEHLGRTASAAAEFTDAIDLAHKLADPREAVARKHARALEPKLSKIHLLAPVTPIPGLTVHRDGIDLTALIGTDLPTDPGEHRFVVSAPGYVESTIHLTVAGEGTILPVQLPALAKVPEPVAVPEGSEPPVAAPPPTRRAGKLSIRTTDAGATILLDGQRVKESVASEVDAGEHTIVVIAAGMVPYETKVLVGPDETREVPVVLDRLPATPVAASRNIEVAISMAPGVKLRGDHPGVIAYRAELTFHLNWRVNGGLFVEYGTIEATNTCGFDMPGAMSTSIYDYGTHYQLTRCSFLTPGLHLQARLWPHRWFDPYVSFAAGYRFGTTKYVAYFATTRGPETSEEFSGFIVGPGAGVDFHPARAFDGWSIGPFVASQVTLYGKESCESCTGVSAANAPVFVTLFFGLRSAVAF